MNTVSNLALIYNDHGVLENHHAAFSSRLMNTKGMDILRPFEVTSRQRFRKVFVESILATDMIHHTQMITTIRDLDRKLFLC